MATEIEDLLLTPGTKLMLELPIPKAAGLAKTVVLRKADKRKLLDLEVVSVGPASRPTLRTVTLQVPPEK